VLIEVAFLWIMVSALIVIGREEEWNLWIVVPAGVVGALLVYGVLYLSMPKREELLDEQIR
jgi:hypothetical protein